MTGRRFGRLTVVGLDTKLQSGECRWLCECDCGGKASVPGRYLRTLRTQSCGCLHKERSRARCIKRNKTGAPQRAQRGKRRKRVTNEREHILRTSAESGEVLRQQDVPEFCGRTHRLDKDNRELDKDNPGGEADGTGEGRDKTLSLCGCS